MQKTFTLNLQWNQDHYDVFIPELGEGIQATGKDRDEAIDNANIEEEKPRIEDVHKE